MKLYVVKKIEKDYVVHEVNPKDDSPYPGKVIARSEDYRNSILFIDKGFQPVKSHDNVMGIVEFWVPEEPE